MWNALVLGIPAVIFLWSFGSLVFDKLAKWSFDFQVSDWMLVDDKHKRYIQMSKRFREKYKIETKFAQVFNVDADYKKREISVIEAYLLPTLDQLNQLKKEWDDNQTKYIEDAQKRLNDWNADYNERVKKGEVIPYNWHYGQPRIPQRQAFRFENVERKAVRIPVKHAKKLPDNFDPVTQTLIQKIDENTQRKGVKRTKKGMHSRLFNIIVWGSVAIAIGTVMIQFALHVDTIMPLVWNTFVAHK